MRYVILGVGVLSFLSFCSPVEAENGSVDGGVYLLENLPIEYQKKVAARGEQVKFKKTSESKNEAHRKSIDDLDNDFGLGNITADDIKAIRGGNSDRIKGFGRKPHTMHVGGINFKSELITWVKPNLTVAFNGGSEELRTKIELVASKWTQDPEVNIQFSFKNDNGKFREWSISDKEFKADIRVGFFEKGASSLIGNDSINEEYTKPGKASINLGGFPDELPDNWEVLVLHEFGHALGLLHEYQNPDSKCHSQLRWEDDKGYEPLQKLGQYQYIENNGKWPGVITYLKGYPNYWSEEYTRKNLGEIAIVADSVVSSYDPLSIMRYPLPEFLFKQGAQSGCFSKKILPSLSAGDIEGIRKLYPKAKNEQKKVLEEKIDLLKDLSIKKSISAGSKSFYKEQIKNSIDNLKLINPRDSF